MLKKILMLALVLTIALASVPAFASDASVAPSDVPVTFSKTITVTEDGGRYQVGFVNLEFKKDFIDETNLPLTLKIEVYAENGTVYLESDVDTGVFCKYVHIRVADYNGLIYDRAAGKNIEVSIRKQQLLVKHFSRYAFQ